MEEKAINKILYSILILYFLEALAGLFIAIYLITDPTGLMSLLHLESVPESIGELIALAVLVFIIPAMTMIYIGIALVRRIKTMAEITVGLSIMVAIYELSVLLRFWDKNLSFISLLLVTFFFITNLFIIYFLGINHQIHSIFRKDKISEKKDFETNKKYIRSATIFILGIISLILLFAGLVGILNPTGSPFNTIYNSVGIVWINIIGVALLLLLMFQLIVIRGFYKFKNWARISVIVLIIIESCLLTIWNEYVSHSTPLGNIIISAVIVYYLLIDRDIKKLFN